jgi:DNA mismatch repair protein MutS
MTAEQTLRTADFAVDGAAGFRLVRDEAAPSPSARAFRSILYIEAEAQAAPDAEAPEPLRDLNLDQVVAAVTAGRDEYRLSPFFYAPLRSVAAVKYRQDVFRDLEDRAALEPVRSFAHEMQVMREHLAQAAKLHYPYQKKRWFLDAVAVYCDAVRSLARDLQGSAIRSRGLLGFLDYLVAYTASDAFTALVDETIRLQADLAKIRYCLHIQGNRIRVRHCRSEPDYSAEVLQTFDKFKQGAVKERRFSFSSWPDMNHVEAAILDRVARLFPETFSDLDEFCTRHDDYLDETVARFDREVQFYLAWIDYLERLRRSGLSFCYPEVTDRSKEISGRDVFDLALADRLQRDGGEVVTNDFSLYGSERIIVVTGPNQSGKTTFARTIGQLHYLASLGCPVPGREARLFLCDRLFTHFEREEDLRNLSGKLQDDLQRIHAILESATSNSLLIMNESFASTTLSDALFLSTEVLRQIMARDLLCVCVTFLDELASLGPATVSMVSQVDPEDPALRTFKITRRAADGLAYAVSIAEKYGLTYRSIRQRLQRRLGGDHAAGLPEPLAP